MAKVKSALEIALERAGQISLTPADRLRYKRQELLKQAERLLIGYRDGQQKNPEQLREWLYASGVERPEDRMIALSLRLTERFGDAAAVEWVFSALEAVGLRDGDRIRQQVDKILKDIGARAAVGTNSIKHKMVEKLKRKGISGSAVVVPDQPESVLSEQAGAEAESERMLATVKRWCIAALGINPADLEEWPAFEP